MNNLSLVAGDLWLGAGNSIVPSEKLNRIDINRPSYTPGTGSTFQIAAQNVDELMQIRSSATL